MNKDVFGLIYRIVYRIKNGEMMKDYREHYRADDVVGCICNCYSINYRNVSTTSFYSTNIYKLGNDVIVGKLSVNYYNLKQK